jgi:lipopolysaccharide biosynthesis glycosyltransferase
MIKPKMNIMTSADDGIAEYILPQLASLSVTNNRYNIDFYLFHSSISDEKIKLIADFAESVHIGFFEVRITDKTPYEQFVKAGGRWPAEAYYTVGLHKFLPETLDRIMYVDAGDAFWNGDCGRFYFADFEDKAAVATMYRSKITRSAIGFPQALPLEKADLDNPQYRALIVRGAFSSGTVLYNLEKIRGGGYEFEDFAALTGKIAELSGTDTGIYFGDQGLLSAAYLGDVKYWGFPSCVHISEQHGSIYNFTAYNHEMSMIIFKKDVPPGYIWIEPVIVHFDAPEWKPWKPKYNEAQIKEILYPDPNEWHIPDSIEDWQSVYWDYVRMTPIYEQMEKAVLAHCKGNNITK